MYYIPDHPVSDGHEKALYEPDINTDQLPQLGVHVREMLAFFFSKWLCVVHILSWTTGEDAPRRGSPPPASTRRRESHGTVSRVDLQTDDASQLTKEMRLNLHHAHHRYPCEHQVEVHSMLSRTTRTKRLC
jgi:hypothetical protein